MREARQIPSARVNLASPLNPIPPETPHIGETPEKTHDAREVLEAEHSSKIATWGKELRRKKNARKFPKEGTSTAQKFARKSPPIIESHSWRTSRNAASCLCTSKRGVSQLPLLLWCSPAQVVRRSPFPLKSRARSPVASKGGGRRATIGRRRAPGRASCGDVGSCFRLRVTRDFVCVVKM